MRLVEGEPPAASAARVAAAGRGGGSNTLVLLFFAVMIGSAVLRVDIRAHGGLGPDRCGGGAPRVAHGSRTVRGGTRSARCLCVRHGRREWRAAAAGRAIRAPADWEAGGAASGGGLGGRWWRRLQRRRWRLRRRRRLRELVGRAMKFLRLMRHIATTRWSTRRHFTPAVRAAIERAIAECEAHHAGEIRFVVETAFDLPELWHDLPARQRAVQLFGQLGVWDTAHNNGVLIYVLMADRVVEIVADRGIAARIAAARVGGGVPAHGAALPGASLPRGLDRRDRGRRCAPRAALPGQGGRRPRAAEPAGAAVAIRRQSACRDIGHNSPRMKLSSARAATAALRLSRPGGLLALWRVAAHRRRRRHRLRRRRPGRAAAGRQRALRARPRGRTSSASCRW